MKPRVFIASSSQHEAVLDALATAISGFAIFEKWTTSKGDMSQFTLESVTGRAYKCDFGIFILARDSRWGEQINGNVLMELGFFLALRKRENTLLLRRSDTDLPADLLGLITATYDGREFADAPARALEDARRTISRAIHERKTLADEVEGLWIEKKTAAAKQDETYSLVSFTKKDGQLKVRGRAYKRSTMLPIFSHTATWRWPLRSVRQEGQNRLD
jgi:hypothetical protein